MQKSDERESADRKKKMIKVALFAFIVGCLVCVGSAAAPKPHKVEAGAVSKIIGGTSASISAFPYQVGLYYTEDNKRFFTCGGSIHKEQWVITAAHCVAEDNGDLIPGRVYYIGAGSNVMFQTPQYIQVSNIYVHPNYASTSNDPDNDIALMELSSPFTFNSDVKAIDIAQTPSVGSPVTASGWGLTSAGGELSSTLNSVIIPVRQPSDCGIFGSFQTSIKFCAGTRAPNKDTCQGDSGGPAVDSQGNLVGITSYGSSECLGDGVYTRVDAFVTWIESIVSSGVTSSSSSIPPSAANPNPPSTTTATSPQTTTTTLTSAASPAFGPILVGALFVLLATLV